MLSIEVSAIGSIPVLQIAGELTQNHAMQLRGHVKREIAAGGAVLILETSGITLVDLQGLRELHLALKLARRAGGEIMLANPSDILREWLLESRLDEIVRIRESLDEAAAALDSSGVASH